MPTFTWVSMKAALSDATTMSESTTKCSPPPTHRPLTAQITGFITRFWCGDQNTESWSGRFNEDGLVPLVGPHVEARAEVPVSGTREHRDANPGVVAHLRPERPEDALHGRREGVAALRPVQRHEGDLVAHLVADPFERAAQVHGRLSTHASSLPSRPRSSSSVSRASLSPGTRETHWRMRRDRWKTGPSSVMPTAPKTWCAV